MLTFDWNALTTGPEFALLQQALPTWLMRQRWFGAKARTIVSTPLLDWVQISAAAAIFFVRVLYEEGEPDTYQLPLALLTTGDIAPERVLAMFGTTALYDATGNEEFQQVLLQIIIDQRSSGSHSGGILRGHHSAAATELRESLPLLGKISPAEQSNTSIRYGRTMILKLFRRLESGQNPDVEIGRFLTDVTRFPHIPRLLGDIVWQQPGSAITTTAMLQDLVTNDGDGWEWTLAELVRFYQTVATLPAPANDGTVSDFLHPGRISAPIDDLASSSLDAAALLGQRTAEMHLALATETTDAAFSAEPLSTDHLRADALRIHAQIDLALDAVSQQAISSDITATILKRRSQWIAQADALLHMEPSGQLIRIHGDYHLGQTLRANDDFVLLDFEGEPAAPLAQRCRRQCPLKDVAGMLRSFSYAAWVALEEQVELHPESRPALESWLRVWLNAVSTRFLNAWRETMRVRPDLLPESHLAQTLLNAYLLEKALYELRYELNNRPTWVHIPLAGIAALPSAPAYT